MITGAPTAKLILGERVVRTRALDIKLALRQLFAGTFAGFTALLLTWPTLGMDLAIVVTCSVASAVVGVLELDYRGYVRWAGDVSRPARRAVVVTDESGGPLRQRFLYVPPKVALFGAVAASAVLTLWFALALLPGISRRPGMAAAVVAAAFACTLTFVSTRLLMRHVSRPAATGPRFRSPVEEHREGPKPALYVMQAESESVTPSDEVLIVRLRFLIGVDPALPATRVVVQRDSMPVQLDRRGTVALLIAGARHYLHEEAIGTAADYSTRTGWEPVWNGLVEGWLVKDQGLARGVTDLKEGLHSLMLGKPADLIGTQIGLPGPAALVFTQVGVSIPLPFDRGLVTLRRAVEFGGILVGAATGNAVLVGASVKSFVHDEATRVISGSIEKALHDLGATEEKSQRGVAVETSVPPVDWSPARDVGVRTYPDLSAPSHHWRVKGDVEPEPPSPHLGIDL
jgi:hypothetical protein